MSTIIDLTLVGIKVNSLGADSLQQPFNNELEIYGEIYASSLHTDTTTGITYETPRRTLWRKNDNEYVSIELSTPYNIDPPVRMSAPASAEKLKLGGRLWEEDNGPDDDLGEKYIEIDVNNISYDPTDYSLIFSELYQETEVLFKLSKSEEE